MGKKKGQNYSRRGSISGNRIFGAGYGRWTSQGLVMYFSLDGAILSLWDLAGHLYSQGLGGPGLGSQQDLQCVGRVGPPSQLLQPCTRPGTLPGWHWPQTWLEEASAKKGWEILPPEFGVISSNVPSGPDQAGQLVKAWSQYAKVAGSIPSQGTYKKQPMNA